MLSSEIVKKIEDFVYAQPRSMQEIASHIQKNWRTADRYIDEIEKQYGTIAKKIFREGTRGALKIIYWASIDKISRSVFQEQLEKQIFLGKKKEDFSAFDIFQHVKDKNKRADVEFEKTEDDPELTRLHDFLIQANNQILIFSGNLSFTNLKNKNIDISKTLEKSADKGINIKILTRIDIAGIDNIKKILSINHKLGKENIEAKHIEQPLRAIIIDNKIIRLKEIKEPTGKKNELEKKIYLYYEIKDKEWAEWLSKIFWKMFSSSVGAEKRMEQMGKIRIFQ